MAAKLKGKFFFVVFIKNFFGGLLAERIFYYYFYCVRKYEKRGKGKVGGDKDGRRRKKTYINYIILGIVSVCAANIQPVAIVHWLHDPYVIAAVEELFFGRRHGSKLKIQINISCV